MYNVGTMPDTGYPLEVTFFFFFLFWILPALLIAWWASSKGRSAFSGFLLSFFFSPLIGAIIVGFLSRDEAQLQKEGRLPAAAGGPAPEMKKCPFCGEDIRAEAIVCRYCGRDLNI